MTRFLFLVIACLALMMGAVAQQKKQTTPKKPTKVQQTQSKLKSVEQQKKAAASKLKDVRQEKTDVTEEMRWVNNKLTEIKKALSDTQSKLKTARTEQAAVQDELDIANKRLEETKDRVKARIRSMYKQGDEPMVLVLIGSRDVASFASRRALLERIARRDRELFDGIKRQREEIAVKKRKKDAIVAQIAELRVRQKEEELRLAQANEDRAGIVAGLDRQETRLERELDELEQQSARLEGVIRAYQAAQRPGSAGFVGTFRGGFARPTTGRISSGFGYRVHPISGRRRMHAGVDFAAPTGTPIWASAAGVVISSGWMGGYGNTVVINHGSGLSTLYGHCSRLLVRPGQRVKQGERIALVGSTGYSTGPHLHFEIRVNGRPINPLSRL